MLEQIVRKQNDIMDINTFYWTQSDLGERKKQQKTTSDDTSLMQIILLGYNHKRIIKQKKKISHRELLGPKYLNWDSETKFDGYRKAILNTKGINEVRKVSKGKRYSWKSYYEYLEI